MLGCTCEFLCPTPLGARPYADCLAVFGHSASGKIEAFLLKHFYKLLVRKDILHILGIDQRLDPRLDRSARRALAIG